MIVGNGLIGKSLIGYDREDIVFIAAGVSDSKCVDLSEFERERNLVEQVVQAYPDKLIVFFSSFSINDPVMQSNLYVTKKLQLEDYLVKHCRKYIIIRISNLVGKGGNPRNVFNFFYNQIIFEKPFTLWANSKRNFVMVDDSVMILNHILENKLEENLNSIINIVNNRDFTVYEIVEAIEQHTGKKARYNVLEIERLSQRINGHSINWFELLHIDTTGYLKRILENYFSE